MRPKKIPWYIKFHRALFKHQLRPYLVDNKHRVIPAFSLGGVDYWCFDNTHEVPAGRALAALTFYDEMERRVGREYLIEHTKAMDEILSDPKRIRISHIMQLNIHLKERLNLAPFPEHIYKLASVIFFDKNESLYGYDFDYNEKKIERWKSGGGSLDFFSRTPLNELIPSLKTQGENSQMYSQVVKMISERHHTLLQELKSAGS